MNYRTDLILAKAFCLFISFHFPDSVLSLLTGLHFYFWWRDIENTELYLFFIRKSCNLHKLLKSTSSLNFDPYLYIRILLRFLWVNSYANKQKCKQWLHEESVYSWHGPELRRGKPDTLVKDYEDKLFLNWTLNFNGSNNGMWTLLSYFSFDEVVWFWIPFPFPFSFTESGFWIPCLRVAGSQHLYFTEKPCNNYVGMV